MATSQRATDRAARLTTKSSFEWLYAAYALAWALFMGCLYFSALEHQLFLSQARAVQHNPQPPSSIGMWSGPLDDVFIHFDFARSAARGFPFQWSEGNGYSSGGTSLLYPLILAIGYRIGYQGLGLMWWAGIVATVSVFAVLQVIPRALPNMSRLTWLIVPPMLFSVGALNWSLWSGMEVAFFLAVWAGCFGAWLSIGNKARSDARVTELRRLAAWLGAFCTLLVATRPEAALVVACFALSSVITTWKHCSNADRLRVLLYIAVAPAVVVVGQTCANKYFTGETAAAGALVKLEAYDPRLNSSQVWDAWLFHLKYQVLRVTDYHLSDATIPLAGSKLSYGWLLWLLSAVPLFVKATRRTAVMLWLSAAAWLFTVSFNGQVRWQNERYTMPAVAWLLVSATVGLAWALEFAASSLRKTYQQVRQRQAYVKPALTAALTLILCFSVTGLYAAHQNPRQREQLWFFGRASRNIYDQHVTAGRLLTKTPTHRVLVGDAGAIPYVSDLPALDIIGLGGYGKYPFARATRLGLPAAIELVQRMPLQDRPDTMAIYPTWWDELPQWFGNKITEVPVRGNVICGGASKVLYQADWRSLPPVDVPSELNRRERVVLELDFADLVSEREAGVRLVDVAPHVAMKLLPHPKSKERELWDGARIFPQGAHAELAVPNVTAHVPLSVVVRVAPSKKGLLSIRSGAHVETIALTPSGNWSETKITLPARAVRAGLPLEVHALEGEVLLYHLWVIQEP
jgi:hypothetical protein